MISCKYCDGYNDRDILTCPFEEIYNDLVSCVFQNTWSFVMPDNFILTKIEINGYAGDVILFSLNLTNNEYISYFGHKIKINSYKNIHKESYGLLSDKIFNKMFSSIDCFEAHSIKIKV